MDNFQADYDQVDKEITSLTLTLEEVASIKKNNPSGSVVAQEFKMKQSNLKIKNQMLELENLASEYQNSGSKFNLTAQNRQKRIDKIIALKKKATEAQAAYNAYIQNKTMNSVDEEQPMARGVKGEDGEYDHTRDLDNRGLL